MRTHYRDRVNPSLINAAAELAGPLTQRNLYVIIDYSFLKYLEQISNSPDTLYLRSVLSIRHV